MTGPRDPSQDTFRATEHQLEARSAAFRKELGLRDLVLTQVLFVVGLGWVGTAARVGPSHLVFWLLAIALFYLPSAAVVIYLTRLMPRLRDEGVSLLLVEQNLKLAEAVADVVYVMVKGRMVYHAPLERFRAEREAVKASYLTL